MPRRTERQVIDAIAEKMQPRVRMAFIEAVESLRNDVVLAVFVERLERGDIFGAMEALNIEQEAFSRVERALLDAYNEGGQAIVDNFPRIKDPEGQPIIYRWGVRNLPAEQEMRTYAGRLIRGITDDAREGIREVLTEGLAQGRNPRVTARNVVGRRNRANNRREGGYLGLTRQQMQTVAKVRRGLAAGDTDMMRDYLGYANRDKRFDATIRKAIEEGRALPADYVNKVAGQYAERSLDYRGRVVAREETMTALARSRDDAYEQQIGTGKLDAQDVTLTWLKTPREHPRLQHIEMNGKTVAYGEPFIMPDGTWMRYPHDPDAPARHKIGCQCRVRYDVDFAAAALRRYRARTGR